MLGGRCSRRSESSILELDGARRRLTKTKAAKFRSSFERFGLDMVYIHHIRADFHSADVLPTHPPFSWLNNTKFKEQMDLTKNS